MDTMKNATPILTAILALMLSAYSSADELTDAAETSLGCPQLMNAGEVKTPECTEYDRLAKAAGAVTP
jgi:hypothetical protein